MRALDILLTTLLVIAIVTGLQAVGVVLMSAMIVAPAVAARQWSDRLVGMVALSALFGALAGVSGAILSSQAPRLSTGPTIVLCISLIVLFSLLFAPNRGLLWAWARQQRNRRRLRLDAVLGDMYTLASHHDDMQHPHTVSVLQAMNAGNGGVGRSLRALEERGWASRVGENQWALTQEGIEAARQRSQEKREANHDTGSN